MTGAKGKGKEGAYAAVSPLLLEGPALVDAPLF